MRRLAAIVLVLLLAGCTRVPEEPEARAESAASPASAPAAPALTATASFAAAPTPTLPVSLAVVERWVRPVDEVIANATARASSYEWYLAPRNPLWTPRDPGPYGLAVGGTATLDVRAAGRHGFALEGSDARLRVSIVEGALPLRLESRLVAAEGAPARFAPDELIAGPGSLVTLSNDLPAGAVVTREDEMVPLRGEGASVRFRMDMVVDELGDYDLVVVARDGAGAVGEASARIVYDNRKPDAERSFGPFHGSYVAPPAPGTEEPLRHAWTSENPLRSLRVAFATTTMGFPPGEVRVTLEGPDGEVVGSAERDGFEAAGLPAGDYAFLVEPLAGTFVQYDIEAEGVWELQAPESFFSRD